MNSKATLLAILLFTLCTLHAEEITYTIISSTAVEEYGDLIDESYADFSRTGSGNKQQITEGNTTTLTIHGMDGATISSVILSMHSNKSAGTGSLVMNIGNRTVWQIDDQPFSSKQWNGSYTNSFVDIYHSFSSPVGVGDNQTVSISISASVNSLYIQSYTIIYEPPVAKPHTVYFLTGTDDQIPPITERGVGFGVTMPDYSYSDNTYHFIGWIEYALPNPTTYKPIFFKPGYRYFPKTNTALIALYTDQYDEDNVFYNDTTYHTDSYILANSTYEVPCIAIGGVVNSAGGVQATQASFPQADNGLWIYPYQTISKGSTYHIEFLTDSTLTIYSEGDNSYIGYNASQYSAKLNKQPQPWSFQHLPDNTFTIFHEWDDGKKRSFSPWYKYGNPDEHEVDVLYFTCSTALYSSQGLLLFRVDDMPIYQDQHYVTFITQDPDNLFDDDSDGIETLLSDYIQITPTAIINTYHIPLQLLSINGHTICSTTGNIDLQPLTSGPYILVAYNAKMKVFVR